MNGSMANGSRRTTPTAPVAAAVVSEESVAPMNTPWFQSRAAVTRGIVVLRRRAKKAPRTGAPPGAPGSGARAGEARGDRPALRVVVLGRQDRALGDRRAAPAVRVAGGLVALRRPVAAL